MRRTCLLSSRLPVGSTRSSLKMKNSSQKSEISHSEWSHSKYPMHNATIILCLLFIHRNELSGQVEELLLQLRDSQR